MQQWSPDLVNHWRIFKKIILRGQFTIKNTGISGSEIFKIPLKLKSTLKGL
jgi:hypothetical protein